MGKGTIKIPWWKYLLSYVTEIHLESRSSDYNDHLEVLLVRGRFQLCAADAIYSFDDLYDNYYNCFKNIKVERLDQVKEVLILGLGLGSIPLMLERHFKRAYNYTAVEIDENVVELNDIYTLPRLQSSIQTITGDAEIYVKSTSEKYDLIAVDIFINDLVPEHFESLEFLESLTDLVNEGGLILFNQLGITEKDQKHTTAFYKQKFKQIFPNSYLHQIKGNYILVNDKSALIHTI